MAEACKLNILQSSELEAGTKLGSQRKNLKTLLDVVIICLTGALFHSTPCSAQVSSNPSVTLQVSVNDVTANRLLIAIGEITKTNWVIGSGLLKQKISLNVGNANPNAITSRILATENLRVYSMGSINTVMSECRWAAARDSIFKAQSPRGEAISLHFQEIGYRPFLDIISGLTGLTIHSSVGARTMSMRIKDEPWDFVLAAAMMAEGDGSLRTQFGSTTPRSFIQIQRDNCTSANLVSESPRSLPCVAMEGDTYKGKREPMECYRVEDFAPKGYVTLSTDGAAVSYVLLEGPNKLLYSGKIGNFIGPNFGVIKEISTQGFAVKEVVQDPIDRLFYEQTTFIDYSGTRAITERRAP